MNAPVSARGLFRATGKKSKPVAIRDLEGNIVKVDALEREENEFYPTPVDPIRSIIHAEMDRLRDFPAIWGPACGTGVIGRELRTHGFRTFDSDLIDRGCGAEIKSFYDFKEAPARAMLENPPFAECGWGNGKARWLYHALETLDIEYMGLLMNWGFPGAGGLAPFWAKYPPARVYLMRWKIDFTGQGAPPMLNGWFIWDKAWKGETVLRMLDRKDARQGEMDL
ncbi:hypothetical protein [Aliirhizobium cellulosilyticum]|uniref:SAM-dependent methyltransferase n=1 Tax=Aliirhizobium cellulosilyticum TaxID=393664 RepID=A0A7W6X8G4_9HYPH|nr:hypothetical protein [Rhizobium cellulosilyticum]MBB4347976.1 hypothetical protein [Rhizobium cellulosilyticum]MBB4409630.1 hypothetical protein [Rhizobium cellulosilyticum]MBB4444318.1 hypothetical protein [Rhizobium cellulosilyticum]